MATKKIKNVLKILIKAGAANPAPPVGSTLGPYGVNLVQFCKEFNDQTATMQGMVPVVITIFEDRTYEFVLKTAPVAELIKQTIKIQKGGANQIKDVAGNITFQQIKEIAEKKMVDLNSFSIDSAINQVIGTCKSMGVKVTDIPA